MCEQKYCVYKHTNTHNGKIYIGVTSQRPSKRWDCGRGYQKNQHFWSAIQKYGWDSFLHEILFDNLSADEAFSKEQELIQEYDSCNCEKGYNLSTGGEHGAEGRFGEKHPMWGKHHTEETKQKIRNRNLGVPFSPERLAAFHAHIDREELSERAKRKFAYCNKGRKWSEESNRKRSESNKGKKRSEESRDRIRQSKRKPILQLDADGTVIKKWDSAKSVEDSTGIDAGHISKVCKGQRKSAGGFKWSYDNEGGI